MACEVGGAALGDSVHGCVAVGGVEAEVGLDGLVGSGDEGSAFIACPVHVVVYDCDVEDAYCLIEWHTAVGVGGGFSGCADGLGEGVAMNTAHGVAAGRKGDGVVFVETGVGEVDQCGLEICFWLRDT